MGQCRALKVETTADRCELRHDGIESVGKVSLLPRISGGAGRPVVQSGHDRRCAGVVV
jgi:hypothetical protein